MPMYWLVVGRQGRTPAILAMCSVGSQMSKRRCLIYSSFYTVSLNSCNSLANEKLHGHWLPPKQPKRKIRDWEQCCNPFRGHLQKQVDLNVDLTAALCLAEQHTSPFEWCGVSGSHWAESQAIPFLWLTDMQHSSLMLSALWSSSKITNEQFVVRLTCSNWPWEAWCFVLVCSVL